jgi:hypothetical protein
VWLGIAIFLFGSKDKEWMDWCGHLFDLHGEITQNRIRINRDRKLDYMIMLFD